MEKGGQVSIIIIVAVVILVIIGVVFFLTSSSSKSDIESAFSNLGIASSASVVESSIIGCLEQISSEADAVIGLQGGYYNKPVRNEDIGFIFIPYYYYEGEFLQPSNKKIERELASYVDDNLELCLSSLSFEDFSLTYEGSKSSSVINEDSVEFNSELTLELNKGEFSETFSLSDHPVRIDSPLFRMIEVATYITETHREDPDFICVSCVSEMAEERELYVDFLDFGGEEISESTTLVVISEDQTNSEPYIFEFLNKYPSNAGLI